MSPGFYGSLVLVVWSMLWAWAWLLSAPTAIRVAQQHLGPRADLFEVLALYATSFGSMTLVILVYWSLLPAVWFAAMWISGGAS